MFLKQTKSTNSSYEDWEVQPTSGSNTAIVGPSTVQTNVQDNESEIEDDIKKFVSRASTITA